MTVPANQQTAHIASLVFKSSISIAIVAATGIFVLAIWLTNHANTLARVASQKLVETAIFDEIDRLEMINEDYGYWQVAFDAVQSKDAKEIYSNLGSSVGPDDLLWQMSLLSGEKEPIITYSAQSARPDTDLHFDHVFAQLHSMLPARPTDDYDTAATFTREGEEVLLHVLSRIYPEDQNFATIGPLPYMLNSICFGKERLTNIANKLGLDDLALTVDAPDAQGSLLSTPLLDASGQPIAYLRWTAPRPGDQLYQDALPLIASLLLVIFLGTAIINIHAARQNAQLHAERSAAQRDSLTGLLNRRGLDQVMSRPDMRQAARDGELAILYLDLNGFKAINDSVGHDAGDQALTMTADRLRDASRETDILARLGGDEFAVCLRAGDPKAAASRIVGKIMANCADDILLGDRAWPVIPSIGVAFTKPTEDWTATLGRADHVMYQAKSAKSAFPVAFEPAEYAGDTALMAAEDSAGSGRFVIAA